MDKRNAETKVAKQVCTGISHNTGSMSSNVPEHVPKLRLRNAPRTWAKGGHCTKFAWISFVKTRMPKQILLPLLISLEFQNRKASAHLQPPIVHVSLSSFPRYVSHAHHSILFHLVKCCDIPILIIQISIQAAWSKGTKQEMLYGGEIRYGFLFSKQ